MENSERVLFEDDSPRWFVAIGEQWVGPLSASDLYQKILAQELTWAHYVWKKGQAEWKRICDVKTFQAAVPRQPRKEVQKQVLKQGVTPEVRPAKRLLNEQQVRNWYLYYKDSQFGPFSQEEIFRFLKIGKIHLKVHVWKVGMSHWERLERIPIFQPMKEAQEHTAKYEVEQRRAPRQPLVAKILLSDEQTVIVGVGRDISTGGMQVLTDRIPGKVGTRIKMNISPSSQEAGRPIEPFVAEGVVVRILEDGRGFSFRFQRLSDGAKKAIESYIESLN